MNTSNRVGHAVGIHTHISQGAKYIHCLWTERPLSGRNHQCHVSPKPRLLYHSHKCLFRSVIVKSWRDKHQRNLLDLVTVSKFLSLAYRPLTYLLSSFEHQAINQSSFPPSSGLLQVSRSSDHLICSVTIQSVVPAFKSLRKDCYFSIKHISKTISHPLSQNARLKIGMKGHLIEIINATFSRIRTAHNVFPGRC